MKVFFTTLMIVAGFAVASAQCTVNTALPNSGLFPVDTCVVKDAASTAVFDFKNFDEVDLDQIHADIDSIRFDSINNLPAGMTWATSNADNVFGKLEAGCIAITGTTNDPVGNYTASVVVTAWINGSTTGLQQNAAVFNPYCGNCIVLTVNVSTVCQTGINSVENVVSSITNSPNPVRNYTNITFTAEKAANYSFKVFDVRGIEVYSQAVEATPGNNSIRFERSDLPAGVYMYSLIDGQSSVTRKMVLAD